MKYIIGITSKTDGVHVEIDKETASIASLPTYEQYMFFRVQTVRCIRDKGCYQKSDVVKKYQEISCNSFNIVFLCNDNELVIYCYGEEKNNLTFRISKKRRKKQ